MKEGWSVRRNISTSIWAVIHIQVGSSCCVLTHNCVLRQNYKVQGWFYATCLFSWLQGINNASKQKEVKRGLWLNRNICHSALLKSEKCLIFDHCTNENSNSTTTRINFFNVSPRNRVHQENEIQGSFLEKAKSNDNKIIVADLWPRPQSFYHHYPFPFSSSWQKTATPGKVISLSLLFHKLSRVM